MLPLKHDAALLDTLPPEQRLALAYAPKRSRRATLGLLALDARLASVLRGAREPVLAQLRFAWWRDQISQRASQPSEGDPLLALLRPAAARSPDDLIALIDGWEALLGSDDVLDDAEIRTFLNGRVRGWIAVAKTVGADETDVERAALIWAANDLAARLTRVEEKQRIQKMADTVGLPRLPRSLRPLAVLAALGQRSGGSRDLVDGGRAMLLALRVGLLGR